MASNVSARRPCDARQHVPEFGSTCAIFPIDGETLRYLELSGRDADHIKLIEAYAKEQGLWRHKGQPDADIQ